MTLVVCLRDDLILAFCYSNLRRETGGFELASTFTLVLQANLLTKPHYDIDMYSIPNEGKFVVAERFIRTLKTKIYKHMTSIAKNVYIDKFGDIADEYNNTF